MGRTRANCRSTPWDRRQMTEHMRSTTKPLSPDDRAQSLAHDPLKGIKVVDFTIIMSGPMCTRALADSGADVIKVSHRPVIHFANASPCDRISAPISHP